MGGGPRPAVLVLNGCGGYEADAGITTNDHAPAGRARRRRAAPRLPRGQARPSLHLLRRRRDRGRRPGPAPRPRRRHRLPAHRPDRRPGPHRCCRLLPRRSGGRASPRSAAARSARSTARGSAPSACCRPIIPGQIADEAHVGKLPPVVIVHGADDQAISHAAPRRWPPARSPAASPTSCRSSPARVTSGRVNAPSWRPTTSATSSPVTSPRSRSASATDRWATSRSRVTAKSPIVALVGLRRAEDREVPFPL